jgi:hypothetical protein
MEDRPPPKLSSHDGSTVRSLRLAGAHSTGAAAIDPFLSVDDAILASPSNWKVSMDAKIEKHACLMYVQATEKNRTEVRDQLSVAGYVVCEVRAELDEAQAAKAGEENLRDEIRDCVDNADLCVFLIPEDDEQDAQIGVAAGYADSAGKPLLGVVDGQRTTFPDVLEDFAPSMVRVGSERLTQAFAGDAIWERPDRTIVEARPIKHVRCQ